MKKRSLLTASLIGTALLLGVMVYLNRQTLKDHYIVATTDLSTPSATLAKKLELTDQGQFLYEASQAELQPAHEFRGSCQGLEQQNIVLGCYTNQRIYVYNVESKQLDGVREVTAAHELLHAAYARLSDSERQRINGLLKAQRAKTTDSRILDTLKLYSKDSNAELLNEMHSIFGTEIKNLSPELEAYYKQYFKDRGQIVAYSDNYQKVFDELKAEADGLKKHYKSLNTTKQQNEAQLQQWQNDLQQQKAALDQLKSDPATYNQRVPAFNQLVNQYNALITSYKQTINQMNEIITQLNENITQQNNLTQKLDSNYSSY